MLSFFRSQKTPFQFQNRKEAGQVLGGILQGIADTAKVLILALPRGGVPVACEVAISLNAPFDVFLVRKLGVPQQPELALGAIASGGVRVLDLDTIGAFGISMDDVERITARERRELDRREEAYRGGHTEYEVAGRTVVLVDDGLATGSTMRAAVQAIRQQRPGKIIVAIPVASVEGCSALEPDVDRVVAAFMPTPFFSVGRWYRDFSPTMDREVRDLLHARAARHLTAS